MAAHQQLLDERCERIDISESLKPIKREQD